MNKQKNDSFLRAKRMLSSDKDLPSGLTTVLRSDIASLLSGYFDLNPAHINIDIIPTTDGIYQLHIESAVYRVKPLKIL